MWKNEVRAYLPGALGDNLMLLPAVLSNAGVTAAEEVHPAIELYVDLARHHFVRGNPTSADVAAKILGWQIDLLKMQPYVKNVYFKPFWDKNWIKQQGIPDFDRQRTETGKIDMGRGDICWRCNFLHRNKLYWDTSKPWLFLPETDTYDWCRNKVVVSATPRYANPFVTWRCLHEMADQCIFIGTKADHEGFYWRTHIDVQFHAVQDFVDMAQIIKHCRFFVGTQSFPCCLAESMKVPRIIIQAPQVPDVIPRGGTGNAVIDEDDFSHTINLYQEWF